MTDSGFVGEGPRCEMPKRMNNSLGHQLKDLIPAWVWCVFLPLPAILFWRSHDGQAMALLLFSIGCASLVAYAFRRDLSRQVPESVCGNRVLGSTGHWPVPSGDSPDGMGRASPANRDDLMLGPTMLIPVGGSPTGTGGSPVLPTYQTCPDALGSPAQIWRNRMRTVGAALFLAFVGFSLESLALSYERDLVSVFLAFLVLIPSICVVPFLTLATRRPVAAVVFSLFIVFCMKLLGGIVVVLVHGWNASRHGHTEMPWTHPNLLVWLFWINTAVLSLVFYLLGARKFQNRASNFTPAHS